MAIDFLRPGWNAPPNVRAVTTTRKGGVSEGPYSSLNLGNHVGDDPLPVEVNRRRVAEALGLPCEPLWLQQVHGTEVVNAATAARSLSDLSDRREPDGRARTDFHDFEAHSPDYVTRNRGNMDRYPAGTVDQSQVRQAPGVAKADGAYVTRPGAVCAVLTADCVPVFLCRTDGAGVALLHAGWRGLAAGVVEAGVRALGQADSLMAWAGPGIGPKVFEIGADVRGKLAAGLDGSGRCFKPAGMADRWYADLYALIGLRLKRAGVERYGYDREACTYTQADRFFSHRRDRITGRMASLIWID